MHAVDSNPLSEAVGADAGADAAASASTAASKSAPRPYERLLIVRLSALGDVVHVLPLLDALRRAYPKAEIGWVVEEKAQSLLAGHPQVDRVWVLPRNEVVALLRRGRLFAAAGKLWRFFRDLRAARYQVTIDAQSNLRSSVTAWLSGAKRRVGFGPGFAKERSYVWRTDRVVPATPQMLKVERNLLLLEPLNVKPDLGSLRARLGTTEEAEAKAASFLAALRQDARTNEGEGEGEGAAAGQARPLVGLHPGVSAFGAIKQWPPERFSELARRLRDGLGARVTLTWGPGERALCEEIAAAADGAAVLAPQTRSILELAALLRQLDVVVGSDTGPVHLAAAVGTPVVGLYGPKDPAIYAPWSATTGRAAETVWGRTHCSPCTLRKCPDVICMPSIEVAPVYEAVVRALAKPRGEGSR